MKTGRPWGPQNQHLPFPWEAGPSLGALAEPCPAGAVVSSAGRASGSPRLPEHGAHCKPQPVGVGIS